MTWTWLYHLVTNPFLMSGLSAWIMAQILKTIIHAAVNGKLDIHRLFGDGGMPSGHSATVTALATASALAYGFDSFQFAISAIFAIIVCHDARGVRLETGKQAEVINDLVKLVFSTETQPSVKLKEFVGHTPLQVLGGILLGILDALVVYHLLA